MAVSLVATAGNASANSYATVAEATTYAEGRLDVTEWDDLTDDQQARLLIQATAYLDTLPLWGQAHDDNEGDLHFPTETSEDASDDAEIPDEVRDAACELAFAIARQQGTAQYSSLAGAGIQSMSEGAVSVTFAQGGSANSGTAAAADLVDAAYRSTPMVRRLLQTRTEDNYRMGWLHRFADRPIR